MFASWLHSGCHCTEHVILLLYPKAGQGPCWKEHFSSSVQLPCPDIPYLPWKKGHSP